MNHQIVPRSSQLPRRQHARADDAGDQDRDRGIERQHVVRQLGHHELEQDPGRHDPGQQEFCAGLRRAAHTAGADTPASVAAGQNVTQNSSEVVARRRAVGFLPLEQLAEAGPARPTPAKKPSPARMVIATNQGNTSTAHQATPTSGRSAKIHVTERSTITSVTTVRNTISGITGPLSSTEAASAVQKIAGTVHADAPSSCDALLGQIGARHRSHDRDRGQQQARIGLGDPSFDAEQDARRHHQAGQHRCAPRQERKRRPIGQQHRIRPRRAARECDRARWWSIASRIAEPCAVFTTPACSQ